MVAILKYLIEVSICLTAFYLLYYFMLAKTRQPQWNRFYLLSTLLLSLVIPTLELDSHALAPYPKLNETVKLLEEAELGIFHSPQLPTIDPEAVTQLHPEGFGFSIAKLITVFYWIGLFITALVLLKRLTKLGILIKYTSFQSVAGFRIVKTNSRLAPFSFLKYIFLPARPDISTSQQRIIFQHEAVHSSQRHSIDILLVELGIVILWFNPVIYLIRKAIREEHEYYVDYQIAEQEDLTNYAKLILQLANNNNTHFITNNFSKTQIKKRITMLHTPKFSRWARLRFLMAVPLMVGLMALFAFKPVEVPWAENTHISVNGASFIEIERKPVQDYIPSGMPIAEEKLKQPILSYGIKFHPITKVEVMYHGMGFFAAKGTEVYATASGEIVNAENMGYNEDYGKIVVIKHGNIYHTAYAHLNDFVVLEGERVKKGELIGYVGNTGKSRFPLLQYQVWKDGERIDPKSTLKETAASE
ncbi:MAG: peptidoglycan DD-metalloendopeptidase family protein [Bacteroidota bacterium]